MLITPPAPRPSTRAGARVPVAQAAQVAARALCDGSGLIVVPTEDGPDKWACTGCTACTTRDEAPSVHAVRLAADPFACFAANDDADEVW